MPSNNTVYSIEPSENFPIVMIICLSILFILALFLIFLIVSGKKDNETKNGNAETTPAETNPIVQEDMRQNRHPFLCMLLAMCLLIGSSCAILFAVTQCSAINDNTGSGSSHLFSRKATNADITLTESQVNLGNLGQSVTFTANADIDGLTLEFTFYDSDNRYITEKIKELGNVVKGRQYTVTFSITEFSFSENLKMSTFRVAVASGTVSVFS